MLPKWALAVALVIGLLVAACGRGAEPTPAPAPAEPTPATAPAEPTPATGSVREALDMNKIFPPDGPGREIMLANCLNHHMVTPIVISGSAKDRDAWMTHKASHASYVALSMPPEDLDLAYEYLANTFGPGKPVPELPDWILTIWTSY